MMTSSETSLTKNKHFSHVTKNRIFKNIHLRRKADRNFSRQFAGKPFQAPKIIFKSPKPIGQKALSYGHLFKDRRLKFAFFDRANIPGFATWEFRVTDLSHLLYSLVAGM